MGLFAVATGLGGTFLIQVLTESGNKPSDDMGAGTAILGFYTLPFLGFSLLDRISFHVKDQSHWSVYLVLLLLHCHY